MFTKLLAICTLILSLTATGNAATFSENWNGTIGDPWASVWSFEPIAGGTTFLKAVDSQDTNYSTFKGADPIVGQIANGGGLAYVNTVNNASNTTLTLTGTLTNTNSSFGSVSHFSPGPTASLADSSYYLALYDDSSDYKVFRVAAGILTQLGSTFTGPRAIDSVDGFVTTKFVVEDDGSGGVDISLSVWDAVINSTTAGTEPGSPQFTFNDPTALLPGSFGVYGGSNRAKDFDQFDAIYTLPTNSAIIPEPASLLLLSLGSMMLLMQRKKKAVR